MQDIEVEKFEVVKLDCLLRRKRLPPASGSGLGDLDNKHRSFHLNCLRNLILIKTGF